MDSAGGGDEYSHWTSYNDISSSPCPSYPVHSAIDGNNLRALLPSYRPCPDYETAVQIKYNNNANNSQPYYANQSTIVGVDLCASVSNQNRH